MLEPLRELARDLWVVRRPLPLSIGDIGARMTVIDLGGELLLHSPVPLDDALQLQLEDAGSVRWIVAPNLVHHLFLGDYVREYPKAVLCGVPGLPEKRADLSFDAVLTDQGLPDWAGRLRLQLVHGAPTLNEVVFLHRASHTLILCDLAFHVVSSVRNEARLFHRLVGATNRFGPHRLVRWFMKDRKACAESMREILEWNFDRVIVSHGEVLETGGREAMQEAFSFLP